MRPVETEAFPDRYRAPGWRERYLDRRRNRRVLRNFLSECVPPPQRQWGAFGRSMIVPPARVSSPQCIFVGDGVEVLENVWMSVVTVFPDIDTRLVIEDAVRIGRGCQLSVAGEVVIGRGTIVGDFVQIGDTFHPYEAEDRFTEIVRPVPVRIGRGVVLGSHVVVLPGVTIGDGAYIEHHSVVGRDVPSNAVFGGYPARPLATATV